MLYLIAYDISDDARRTKLAELLEGFGQRVQRSVFECDLNEREYQALERKMKRHSQTRRRGQRAHLPSVRRLCWQRHRARQRSAGREERGCLHHLTTTRPEQPGRIGHQTT